MRYVNEPVAAIAAEDADAARLAARLIEIEYEELPPVLEPLEALHDDAPVLHEDYDSYVKTVTPAMDKNVIFRAEYSAGDVDSAWAECDVIMEDEYVVPAQQHLYLEPCAAVAEIDGNGKITIWSSTQWVFGVQDLRRCCAGYTKCESPLDCADDWRRIRRQVRVHHRTHRRPADTAYWSPRLPDAIACGRHEHD